MAKIEDDAAKEEMIKIEISVVDRDELIRNGVYAFGYPKDCRITYGGKTYGRAEVFADGEYVGVWDDAKRTFID